MKKTKIIIILITSLIICFLFLLYGPINTFRDYIITSSYTTKSHHFIADFFYSNDTIEKVLNKNRVLETKEITNPKLISVKYNKGHKYKIVKLKENTYNGYLIEIYNPSKVRLATTKYLGKKGENILTISKRNNALIAINGGGFYDPNWSSNGSTPHGMVIKEGKVLGDFKDSSVGGGFIGFDKDNKLILGKMSNKKAIGIYRDAIEFGPFLIINGKQTKIKGNGGWGIAPRTAIGQKKDGTVLFLVINGRIPTSIGASMIDLSNLMKRYGAYNAANLDGGSSSELIINNKIKNVPVGASKKGLRTMATFWIVKK